MAERRRSESGHSGSAWDRREFLRLGAAGALGAVLRAPSAHPQPRAGPRPNILFVMADDLGAECLGCYGGQSYATPHLDALATSGLRFENAYCTPSCTPTRVQVMTGRYPFRTGWLRLIDKRRDQFLDPSKETTFAEVLGSAGYATAVSGKWQLCRFPLHPDHARDCGFDESCTWMWMDGSQKTARYWNPAIWQNGARREGTRGQYGPDLHAAFLTDFIERRGRADGQPFFAYYPMLLPHDPFVATRDSVGRIRRSITKQLSNSRNFAAMVTYADKLVGDLVAQLERLGLRENTLVLFTADNGTDRAIRSTWRRRDLRGGKNTMTEAGTRVPLIASWPGTVPADWTSEALVDLSDVMPTFAELAGAPLPRPPSQIDGHSFAELLQGDRAARQREWVFVQRGQERFVRDLRFRLHQDGRFFDLGPDRYAEAPAADFPRARAAHQRLGSVLERLQA